MKTAIVGIIHQIKHFTRIRRTEMFGAIALAVCALMTGCQTDSSFDDRPVPQKRNEPLTNTNVIALREGDVVRMTFPGAPSLNMSQQIRRDGLISLPLGGEIKAAGLTTAELEKELSDRYASQLLSKEVSVTIESSAFPVFVTGAVLHPGKITSDHPLTALEAIMEAGGVDYSKANLKSVSVVRQENGRAVTFKLNLKLPLEGKPNEPFYLKPSDIVFVPERFAWF
ncbi:MAG TPA: polysaccharide biosynthesis/export family protein [Verrucomicrobiae bacterium]|nr:polysaccharide biosynthesis/export family protein [Verrucomicrobiae bacterium]